MEIHLCKKILKLRPRISSMIIIDDKQQNAISISNDPTVYMHFSSKSCSIDTWNKLPAHITESSSYNIFKKKAQNHICYHLINLANSSFLVISLSTGWHYRHSSVTKDNGLQPISELPYLNTRSFFNMIRPSLFSHNHKAVIVLISGS